MTPRSRAGLGWLLAALGLALYAVALFHPLVRHLWQGGPPAWIEGDVPEEYWPDLVVLCRGLHAGHLPRWNPYEHGGAPFYADPQAGAYYPINWVLCALAGSSPSSHWADARVVIHFWLASLFMVAFLRGEGLGWPASLTGAALFPLTPFMRHNWELNLTWGFAWLPLLLLLSRAAARRPTLFRGALLGAGLAIAALVGSPPALFYAGLVLIPFALHCAWTARREGTRWRSLGATAAVAALMAAALTLPMLAPARELASLSVRARPDFAMIAEGGLIPRKLLGVLLPAMTDHLYVGLLALALALWALRRGSAYAAASTFAGVAAAGLLLMLGDHTPLFALAYAAVPGAATFRDPTRYSALWGTATLILAAAGLDALSRTPTQDAARYRWARAAGGVALGAILVAQLPSLDPHTHGEGLTLAGVALGLGVAALIVLRNPRLAAAIAGAMCVADLLPYLPEDRHTRAGPFPFPEGNATLSALREVTGGDLDGFRTWDEFGIHMRSGSRHELRDLRGYQDPLSLSRYSKVIGALEKTPLLLAEYNVRWVLWAPHYIHGEGHHFLADPKKGDWAVQRAARVWEIPAALPMAYWMDGAEVAADADAALDRVVKAAPSPVVVLERGAGMDGSAGTGVYRPASVTRRSEGLTVEVEAPAAGYVLVNEVAYPGWEARVDGEPAPIARANALVMAVRVPAGAHRIEMAFRPWQPRVFEPLAVAALTAAAVMGVRRRRSGPT